MFGNLTEVYWVVKLQKVIIKDNKNKIHLGVTLSLMKFLCSESYIFILLCTDFRHQEQSAGEKIVLFLFYSHLVLH